VWTLWLMLGILAWTVVALLIAVVVGRGIRLADVRSVSAEPQAVPAAPGDAASVRGPGSSAACAARAPARRRVGLTGIGALLAAFAVTLEAVAYVVGLQGVSGTAGRLLSMDGPVGLPRLYLVGLFAAAAVVAVLGAARRPERRSWWLAVAAVAAVVAGTKAGVVHSPAFSALSKAVSFPGALLVSLVLAGLAVAGLWWLSSHERRDRARVLGALSLYAVASVALSAVSSVLLGVDATWGLTATFVEESVEALAAVAFLAAVLVGVSPRLALPTDWSLRRAGDAALGERGLSPAPLRPDGRLS
jgi:hypothetical protein